MTLRIEKINLRHSNGNRAALGREWDALSESLPQQCPMTSHSWVASYCDVFLTGGEEVETYLVYDGEKLVGVFPFFVTRGQFDRKILNILHNDHTISGDIVLADGYERKALECFLEHVMKTGKKVLYIMMQGNREDSRTLKGLVKDAGVSFVRNHEGHGDYLPIRGSMEEYYSSLSKNFRGNLRKAERKLFLFPDSRFEFLSSDQAGDTCLEEFLNLEASGWKGRRGTAILQNDDLVSFYRALTKNLASRGWLEWHFLRIGEKTIAGHLACRINRTLTLLKIAFDEEYRQCAPGNHLFLKTVKRAYERGDTDEINCLTDVEWHKNWNMSMREYSTVSIYPKTPFPLFFYYLPKKVYILLRDIPWLRSKVRKIKGSLGLSTIEERPGR